MDKMSKNDPVFRHLTDDFIFLELSVFFYRWIKCLKKGKSSILKQTFSLLSDGELVNGVFDRVVLRQDAVGHWLSAEIIDYKTDRDIKNDDDLEVGADRHRKQLEFYCKALSSLTGLPAEKITLKIVFTTVPSLVYL